MLRATVEQIEELANAMRHSPKPHVRIKAVALWNLARGKSREEVAAFLDVSKVSVTEWSKRYGEEGLGGLQIRAGRGRHSQVDPQEVEEYVRRSPREFGLRQTRWTLKALAQVVPSLRRFTPMGVRWVLHRLGFRYKRGQPWLHSPGPQYGEKRGLWSRH